MIFLQSVGKVFMEKTVSLTAMKIVTWPGAVTDLQGSVTEGVKLDGRNQLVIKVSEWAWFLFINFFSYFQFYLYLEMHTKQIMQVFRLSYLIIHWC